jgi:hypothetical protein
MNSQGSSRNNQLPPRFKDLMQGCRQMVRSYLAPLFPTMLDNADVALLEFAGKAETNAAQATFFEAMQELKRKRTEVEQWFFKSVDTGFKDFIRGSTPTESMPVGFGEVSASKLSLVDKNDVEAALPIQNMIAKANANYSEQLYGLNQRMAVVNGGAKLNEQHLPGGPTQLAEAARGAFNLLAIEGKTRLVIYAVFERYLMRELFGMYDEYNRRMVNAGILPNLKYEIRKQLDPRQVKATPASKVKSVAAEQTVGEEAFQSILELMARSHGFPTGASATGTSTTGEKVSEIEAASSRSSILGTIDSIQLEQSGAEAATRFQNEVIENISVDLNLLDRLKTTLADERQRLYGGIDRRRVASADADIIDVVGMLFEYMLQDEALPNVVKALLSRLHTPFLKVAIIDRQLFTEKHHPGRRLLDVMAEAGTRWVTEDDLERGIFPCMTKIVERILSDFKDDLSLFDELLDDFTAHLREIEQKAQIIERRTIEAANGQARLQNARVQANDEINSILENTHLLPEALVFMRQVWVEKLTFILLREHEGMNSEAWKLAVSLADNLIWSLNPQADEAKRDRLHEALPRLRKELREGLEELQGYGRRDNDKMFAQICSWQDQTISRVADAQAVTPAPVETAEPPPVELPAPVLPVSIHSAEVQDMIERLGELEFDTWFEFADADSGRHQRFKLAWYSKISSNYMFVDAMGVKAAEFTRTVLAEKLCSGEARIVELQGKPFLDRALTTILMWLGRNKAEVAT